MESTGSIHVMTSPMQGTVVAVDVRIGQTVRSGQVIAVLEAMKMEHELCAPMNGTIVDLRVTIGDIVMEGDEYARFAEGGPVVEATAETAAVDLEHIRPDLAEVIARRELGLDRTRPDAVAKRRRTGQRTSRENIEHLVDAGTFIEYAPMVVAAQRRRRSFDELIVKTPADGMLAGIGTVNAELFGSSTRVVITHYDYTVLAGTQGAQNHRKKDRLFELAERHRLPVILFAEGGGGRPGDTDGLGGSGLDCLAFHLFGRLSGLVPLVGITSGFCFAGNAALLGCCDVIIATEGSNIGMGGPAMIEGGGLGVFAPTEVGPLEVQVANGVVDIVVNDEAEAVEVAKKYLGFFQGRTEGWTCADQRALRSIVPENRLRAYDTRLVIDGVADTGSVLELRRGFGIGIITVLARIEGRPVGIVANNPAHLGGAIDAEAAEKSAHFMQLCDAFDIPLVFLCDTPGFMVGPEAEKAGLVRRAARLFALSASVDVPIVTVVLRKGYGLGAQAMAGGGFKVPFFTVAWPTGEFGGMGLEGAVRLAYRNELAAIVDPTERLAKENELIARMYQTGKALSTASVFEIDDVIDPADTRRWIMAALESAPAPVARRGKKRPFVDTI
jgi:acetyl-CoA carboxylase carboxyltransferase component